MIRPGEDLALYRADMAGWDRREPGEQLGWRASQRDWVRANDACRRDILDRLGVVGAAAVARASRTPARCRGESTGWTNDRNVTQLLEFMVLRGEVAIAGRQRPATGCGTWPTRVYPDDPVVPADEALRIRNERRLRALGIARARGPECPVEPAGRGRGRRAGRGRGRHGHLAGRPGAAGPAVRGAGGAAVAVRPADPRPQAHGRAVRVRLPAGDVQARRQAALGLLRAADPVRRPAGRASSTPPPTARPACCGSTRSTRTSRSPGA